MKKKNRRYSGKKAESRKGSQRVLAGQTVTGKIEITRGGMGFVIIEGPAKDIMISPSHLGTALDGDTVRVELFEARGRGGRREGQVKEVIKRKQTEFAGLLMLKNNTAFVVPDSPKMPVDIHVAPSLLQGAKDGDMVVVRLKDWDSHKRKPEGEVISVITHSSLNEIAMKGILMENGFPIQFPDEVLEESARIPEQVNDMEGRRDMKGVPTVTIDPVDAKDFDDALSFRPLKDGWFELGVHIADVSHYVTPGSALDREAYVRGTSVYLPDRVVPMLPERLSNELCSLRPDEDKYCFSVLFEINQEGKQRSHWIGKTRIRSQRRFAYEEVQEILEGKEDEWSSTILQMNTIARKIRAQRFQKGAINFSSQEVRFQLDAEARPIGVVVKESKESHQLIEEFMLLANRTVAEYMSRQEYKKKPLPFPYRIHDLPDQEKLAHFAAYAGRLGYKILLNTPDTIAQSFNEMLDKIRGTDQQHVLESLGIRTMSKAVYSTENIGHYGLGFDNYCHFTSPIRRYPDILVHRLLQASLEGKAQATKNMEQICRHCSDQEKKAVEAERAAQKYKQVEFMQDHVGEVFPAVVSGVASFGFWAETTEHKCEGMVSIGDLLPLDVFTLDEQAYALVGQHTGLRFSIGDPVEVQVVATSLAKRQIDFALVTASEGQASPQKQQQKKSREAGESRPKNKDNRKRNHKR